MNRILVFLISFFTFSHFYSQNQNLIGNWILVKTLFNDGKNIEVNNSNYSSKLFYAIKKNSIRINNQNFESVFTNDKIKTPFRTINYTIKDRYLIAQDDGDNKTSYFLKVDDFIQKFPEFKLKEIEKNGKILYVDNDISGYEFNNELTFEDFISKNTLSRDSRDYKNLNFQVEFVLTKENKIEDVKILNSIDTSFDNEYVGALKKSEKYFKNLSERDLLVHDEINQLKWANDLKDNDERKLYQIRAKGLEYYRNNKFGKAIEQFSQIENLDIKNNRFKTLIKECLIDLGICYLATGQNDAACKTFEKIGDKTDFEIRNYILDFCEKK